MTLPESQTETTAHNEKGGTWVFHKHTYVVEHRFDVLQLSVLAINVLFWGIVLLRVYGLLPRPSDD